ncbi:hypothetical protein DY000_02041953 [Brassica cretica]|uniref:RNase H type-1 domain-containing protein n=1 Tax=Brassica cretica TaxID=69181 RepID=A0ABQ7BJ75_BRACR|nr:hypothetical protein DY000_02041953 [Brassica cretica]
MVVMVTSFSSRFRPPPDPPHPDPLLWSLCKSRPFKARFLIVPPEPPDVPFSLASPLQTIESSVNPVVFLPRCSFSSEISTQFLFSARATIYLCRNLLSLSQAFESPLPLNEDLALPLNLLLPQFEDVASDQSLPLYENVARDLSLPLYEDVTLWTDASKNGGFGWCIHGMDEAHDSQSSSRVLYVVSTLATEALTLQVALPSASSAGFSKLQVILDSIVFFSALLLGMDLNEIAGSLLTNFATLFIPLSTFISARHYVWPLQVLCMCSSDYVPLLLYFEI